ncbi:MAG: quinoprotein relay system zinc metallohydrolase 2 [Pseudomonadota bacterium]
MLGSIWALLLFALPLTSLASDPGKPFELIELADGVYVHIGQHAEIDQHAREDSANLGVVVGTQCVAIIDSGGSLAIGERFQAAVRRRTDKPICWVINTHIHFDHVLGNASFFKTGATIIAHQALRESWPQNESFFAEEFADELQSNSGVAKLSGPSEFVESTRVIDLGDRQLRLEAHPPAHSGGDMTILDIKSNTLFAGDLLSRERMPVLDGSIKGWLTWMEQVQELQFNAVVPGHGGVDRRWPEGLQPQLAYFRSLRENVRMLIDEGVFLEDAVTEIGPAILRNWQLHERAHARNVSRTYRELEWD